MQVVMERHLLLVTLLLFVNDGATYSFGRKFLFGIPEAYNGYIKAHISAKTSAEVFITCPELDFHRNITTIGGQTTLLSLPLGVINSGNGISRRSVYIESDVDISVQVMVHEPHISDGFLALPVSTLSTEYYVASYNGQSEFVIAAVEDNTTVSITFRIASGGNVVYNGQQFHNGQHLTVNLNRLEVIELQSSHDLTGTHITSDRPVSLVSGNKCTVIGTSACDLLMEQIPPTSTWRNIYLTANLKSRDQNRLRIISSTDGNNIQIGRYKTITINKGQFHEYVNNNDIALNIRGSHPMLLIQYAEGNDNSDSGDPSMIIVPSQLDYGSEYIFTTASDLPDNYISVTIQTTHIDGLRLDGSKVSRLDVKSVIDLNVSYSVVRASVSPGQHRLWHNDKQVNFAVIAYGFGYYESYGYPLGYNYAPTLQESVTSSCTSTTWHIKVNMDKLNIRYPGSLASDIYFGDNACSGTLQGNILVFDRSIQDCLSSTKITQDEMIHSNQLVYAYHDPQYHFIIRNINWTLDINCHIQRNQSVHSHVTYNQTIGGNQGSLNTTSKYQITTQFFSDPNYLHEISGNPLQVSIGTNVFVKTFVQDVDWTVRMKLNACFTTLSADTSTGNKYYLIKNGCEVDANTHYLSQTEHETKFVFQAFEISGIHDDLYIECDATFCDTSDHLTSQQQCDQSSHCA